jgi:hypothetical protein
MSANSQAGDCASAGIKEAKAATMSATISVFSIEFPSFEHRRWKRRAISPRAETSLQPRNRTPPRWRISAAVAHGCEAIKDQYRFFTVNRSLAPNNLHAPELAEGLTGVVKNALRGLPDIEGGIWQTEQGSLAYAFPTYEGTGEKTDLPPAEEPSIREAAETATFANAPFERRKDSRSQTLLLHSCPLPGPIPHLVAWTMTRVTTAGGRAFAQAMAGLGILLAVVLGSATWLGRLLFSWSRQLRQLESALASSAGELPKLVLTGQRDLDRIVDSLNRAGARLAAARSAADALARLPHLAGSSQE